jgi:TetR/AcrR family transcriptional regulator, ethionamide resistance regulator
MAPTRHASSAPPAGSTPKRRRRTPDEARSEILDAARALLAEHGAQALTISEVMKGTTLSRKAFYVHFEDRTTMLLALLLPLRAGADEALDAWRAGDDLRADGRAALNRAAAMYREHGSVLRAVFWSGGEDPDIIEVRRQLVAPIVEAARSAVSASGAAVHDPDRTATLLATMNVHALLEQAPGSDDEGLEKLIDALFEIWERTLAAPPS